MRGGASLFLLALALPLFFLIPTHPAAFRCLFDSRAAILYTTLLFRTTRKTGWILFHFPENQAP